MSSLNRVSLIGRLGKDPEVRFSASGEAIANLAIATEENWKDREGEKQERTEWHRVVFFGKLAEVCKDFLKKGSQIYLDGRLQTRKWQDSQGTDKYTTEIVGQELKLLGSKLDGAQQHSSECSTEEQEV